MFYIAKCHTVHAGTALRPGDVFEADSQDASIKWRLQQKAIAPAAPDFSEASEDEGDDQQDDVQDCQENHRLQMENLGYDASGDPLEGEESADEEASDEEAAEIEGLEGIVTGGAEKTEPDAEAPVKKTTKGRKKV